MLVTRPAHQAQALVDEIVRAGGNPVRFAAFDVLGRDEDELRLELEGLKPADLVIFVSANAAELGQAVFDRVSDGCRVAAIGPATAARLEALGIEVSVRPETGFDSESLLADPELSSVEGLTVTIVRGDPGRELLRSTLIDRGATVQYLSAYSLAARKAGAGEIDALAAALASGQIDATVIMSVRTLDCLEAILPDHCMQALARSTLVAPGGRVIQTLEERLPGARCVESPGTDAKSIVDALISSRRQNPGS